MTSTTLVPRPFDGGALRAAFSDEAPFRHAIIDGFFEEEDALALHRAFPDFAASQKLFARLFSGRVYGPPPTSTVPIVDAAFAALAARPFVDRLCEITGIRPLAMDETLAGAGMHIGLRGSELPVHSDHNTHPHATWLYRRLNLLIYLNPNWEPSWRSNLLLYDRSGERAVREIEPRFNRAVLMEVHDFAYHGYRALRVPPGDSRQMLAAYFYAPTPAPEQLPEAHGTIFGRPIDIPIGERVTSRVRSAVVHRFPGLLPAPSWSSHAHDHDH